MTIAKLKEFYLKFSLKPEQAKGRLVRFLWALGVPSVVMLVTGGPLAASVVLFETFVTYQPARETAVVVLILLWFSAFMWLLTMPRKWQEEREFEYTADLADGQVVTLNLRTANGVDYADKAMGDFLLERLAKGLDMWERRKC